MAATRTAQRPWEAMSPERRRRSRLGAAVADAMAALGGRSTPLLRRRQAPSAPRRQGALQALLLSAVALPGMMANVAHAAADDAVAGTTAKVQTLPNLADTVAPDESQEFGLQYSHYQEGAHKLFGPYTSGTIPAAAGSTVTGTTTAIRAMPSMTPITADGEHAYARFRLGDRIRLGVEYVQDVWSGASPLATLPANMVTGASTSAHVGGYFNAQGKPVFQSVYQANANPANPAGTPQHLVYSLDPQIGHAMGYASPETRRQTSVRYGYDWNDMAVDVGGGVSSESDFLSRFGNVSVRRDFDDKLTTVTAGLSYTNGSTHAQWNADGYHRMATDAWPGQFNETVPAGTRLYKGAYVPLSAPLITGTRNDVAVTGGITRVLTRSDLFSTGFGYTHTTGFLTNPWKGAYILLPAGPDPAVQAAYPSISYAYGSLELERRPSLRNQFTWDTSYLHYFDHLNAAGQLHYSLFLDSWGIAAHSVDAEWRQSFGPWTLTPRLRYYTQKAADFYAPYFFARPSDDLSKHNFSSDERLSAYGTISPGLSVTRSLARGLTLELGLDYQQRSGALKLGGGGDSSFADLHSWTANVSLRGTLDHVMEMAGAAGDAPARAMHGDHHQHADAPAGVMGAHMMDEPGAVMVGYTFEQQKQGETPISGTQAVNYSVTKSGMWIANMTMTMHMFEFMVAQNAWLNWMVMPQLVDSTMNMAMFEVVGGGSMAGMIMPMRTFMSTGGVGDTRVSALMRLWDGGGQHLHLAQGVSIPTGSVNQRQSGSDGGNGVVFPFDMQNGSGTWDYQPSLTYTGAAHRWNWGAQVNGTLRLQSHNGAGYRLGNASEITAWGGLQLTSWLEATVRGVHSSSGTIRGTFNSALPGPDYFTSDYAQANYGGHFDDAGLGLSARLGSGAYARDKVGFEWLRPLRTDFNGTQPNRVGTLVLNASFMF